jgi:hypothetical protein
MVSRELALFGVVALALSTTAVACGGRAPDLGADAPGTTAWRGEIGCSSDTDCRKGEACSDGFCQMKRCAADNVGAAMPALAKSSYLLLNRELVAVTGNTTLLGYSSKDSALVRTGDPYSAGGWIQDIAGGNFLGTRPDAVAIALAGSTQLVVERGGKTFATAQLGFVPVAIAAGDTDGDGIDEIFAAATDGTFAICKVKTDGTACSRKQGPGGVVDVAMGDVDGDGFAEAVFLVGAELYVYNLDAEQTKQPKVMSFHAGRRMFRIAAGDVDGNGIAEIVGLEDGGTDLWYQDKLDVFSWTEGALAFKHSVGLPGGSKDLHVDHLQAAGDIAVLGASNTVSVLGWGAKDGIVSRYRTTLSGAPPDATRLTGADIDGNSPKATLKGNPKIVSGPVVPLTVLTFPPYSNTFSQGPSNVSLGTSKNTSETRATTVSLNAGVSVSAGFDLKKLLSWVPAAPGASINVGASVGWSWAWTQALNRSVSIGESFSLSANPEADGWDAGAVVIASVCYQQFDYDVVDPDHLMGPDADGKGMSVSIPVGGQTSAWSIRRYNALAEALKTLPKIKLPYRLGEIDSYPKEPQRLDGTPIPSEDLVFKETKAVRVSDSAHTSFSLSASETEVNATSASISYGGSVTVGADYLGYSGSISVHGGYARGTSYDIAVGPSTSFSGGVEPIRNIRDTPEDEFALNGYSFRPFVYRQRYTDASRNESAFFVMVYSVGR